MELIDHIQYYSDKLVNSVKSFQLSEVDEKNVVVHALKSLRLYDEIKSMQLQKNPSRNLTSLQTRKLVWEYWHDCSQETSDTTRPAKLRKGNRSKIQSGLVFSASVNIIQQRGKEFYESMWRISHQTITDLHKKYLDTYPANPVSLGTFFSLLPFYVRGVTTRDVEVCCCKLHLHARWGIKALIMCLQNHGINPAEFNDYYSFFDFLTKNCEDDHAHISWECTPNKKHTCGDITGRSEMFTNKMTELNPDDIDFITFRMEHFESVLAKTKLGIEKEEIETNIY